MFKKILLGWAGAMVAATGLSAAAQAATQVELKNMAAKVVVIAEDRADVALSVSYGKAKLPTIMVHTTGDKFIADGKIKMRHMRCHADGSVDVGGVGKVAASDLPVVYLRVPKNASIGSGGATFGQVNDTQSLDLAIGGCGNWTVGNVAQKAEIAVGGSGSVVMGNANNLDIAIGGSGDVKAGNVHNVEISIGGSGDVGIKSVNGNIDVSIGGNGDVNVEGGNVQKLDVSIAGSGDVRVNGTVKDIDASIAGSGDIWVKTLTGHVDKSIIGSGKVRVGE